MTESDKQFISKGVLELGNCLISMTSLFKAGLITKNQLDNCANIFKVVKENYRELKEGEVPLREELSKITSTKGLITENLDPFVKLIKSKEEQFNKYKLSRYTTRKIESMEAKKGNKK